MPNLETQKFLEKLAAPGDKNELIMNTQRFIRSRIREMSFVDKILPPEHIDPASCQRSTKHEGLVKIIDVEPDSAAVIQGWKSGPDSQYVVAERSEVPFVIVTSQKFEKFQEELLSYEMPITKVLEDNTIRDIHERKDFQFSDLSYQATLKTGKFDSYAGLLDKAAIRKGADMIDGGKLATSTILMSKLAYNQLASQGNEFFGANLTGDVTVNGYRYPTFMGHSLVVSIKSDLLTRNPYDPSNPDAYSFIADGTPYDPGYAIGINLNGMKVGNSATGALYPAKDVANGRFVSGTTDGAPQVLTGGTTVASTAGALGPTTKLWLGNTVLFYTRPNFLGKNYMLQDVNFFIDQRGRLISWEAWINWALALINVKSVAQITLRPVL